MNTSEQLIPKPYVGVSGVTSPEMQLQLEQVAEEAGLFKADRILALGVKAVHKTQYLDTENKYGAEWYPVGEHDFSHALSHNPPNPTTIAVAQAYLDIDHVDDPDYRHDFTARIARRGQPWIQAIQFDMLPWHRSTDMLHFLEETKHEHELAIFLQCHKSAMEELGPRGVARRLGHYANHIDYILFDSSHGTGQRLDISRLDGFVDAMHEEVDGCSVGVAVAGGLNAEVVRQDLPTLLDKYPNLSWDAEGQLHPASSFGKRPLDMRAAADYLHASAEVISLSR